MPVDKEKKLSVEYLYVAVFTTVTALIWVGFEVFRAVTTPAEIEQVDRSEILPLSSELDAEGLRVVRDRLHLPQELLDSVEVSNVQLAPEPPVQEPVKAGTESARIETEIDQEATSSGDT